MSRSIKKGPFVAPELLKRVEEMNSSGIELFHIHVVVVFRVGHSALEELNHGLRGSLGGLHEDGHGGVHQGLGFPLVCQQ